MVTRDVWTGIRLISGGNPWVAAPIIAGCDSTIVMCATRAFRPERFSREKGIDYSAFVIRKLTIGGRDQWRESSAEDLFKRFVTPMDPLLVGLDIVVVVRNVSDRSLPFATAIEGRVIY